MRGRVIDEEGNPIAGAAIAIGGEALTTTDALANPRARSSADGCFEVDFAEPSLGEQQRILLGDKGRTSVRLDRECLLSEGRGVGRVIDLGPILLPRAVTVRGTVRNKAGDPIPGARVVATDLLGLACGARRGPRFGLEHASFGITDSKGMVVLPGIAPTGARIVVSADGYYEQEIPVLSHGDPLNVELQPGGFVEGIVLDADDKPCSAYLWTSYEVDGRSGGWMARCVEGKFRINLRHPHRYRIRAFYGASGGVGSISEVLDGPARGVEVRPVRGRRPGRDAALTICVIDAGSGAAVDQALAAVLWDNGRVQARTHGFEYEFEQHALRSGSAGEILLPGPGERDPDTGSVIVRAKGYAQQVVRGVRWSGAPSKLEVKLVPESWLAGIVVDERTGEPVEGATVMLDGEGPQQLHCSDQAARGRLTDKDGKFRIGGVGAGSHRLRAWVAGRPISDDVEVEVAESAERSGLRLVIPRGGTFSGHLIGSKVPAGSHLVLWLPRQARPASSIEPAEHSYAGFIDASGGFTLHGVTPGESDVVLLVPHRQGRGGWTGVPIEAVHIEQSQAQKDLDIGGVRIGSIRGAVRFSGADCVREHLMVRAVSDERWDVVVEPVANDWTFQVPAAPGSHRLQVVDLTTGVVLALGGPVRVEGARPVDLELSQDLVRVRVRLEPEDPGQPVVAANLEVLVKHALRQRGGNRDEVEGFIRLGDGVSLADGRREVEVLLPTILTKLRVRSNAGEVLGGLSWSDEDPLGELEFTPESGNTETVVIKVRAPTRTSKEK